MDRIASPREHARSGVSVTLARPEDEAEIRRVLRSVPLEGNVVLGFEREPDARIAAAVEGERHHAVLVRPREGGPVVGIGSRSVRRVRVAGSAVRVGYLGLLRRQPGAGKAARGIAAAYEELERTRRDDEAPWDYTSILDGNARALRLLAGGRPDLPRYVPIGKLTTIVAAARPGRRFGEFERATESDLPEVVACLARPPHARALSPAWTLDDLRSAERCRGLRPADFYLRSSGSTVTACMAIWDQREFKQTIVHGYAGTLARFRPLIDAGLRLFRRPALPGAPSVLRHAFLSHVGGDPSAFAVLAKAVRAEAARRGLDFVTYGTDPHDPALADLRRGLPGRALTSTLYAVHPKGRPVVPTGLEGALLRPEVALL